MPRLKQLSGADLLTIFKQLGFAVERTRGSHVKLRRVQDGVRQTLTVPMHSRIDTGTARAVFRQALKYVPESDLRPHFYTE